MKKIIIIIGLCILFIPFIFGYEMIEYTMNSSKSILPYICWNLTEINETFCHNSITWDTYNYEIWGCSHEEHIAYISGDYTRECGNYSVWEYWVLNESNQTATDYIYSKTSKVNIFNYPIIVKSNISSQLITTDTILANRYATNTTKDIDTKQKIIDKIYYIENNDVPRVTKEGKISNELLFSKELCGYGSYCVDAIAHYNRVWLVELTIQYKNKIKELENRLANIESDLCSSGNKKYC
jgi:hypothetical protein